MRQKQSRAGFTLIELMVVVGIMGVLSAIAIPSFSVMVRRSKTAEVASNLNSLFKSAASYYASERAAQGNIASVAGHCTVQDATPSPLPPTRDKQPFEADESFRALGFHIADQVYYSYGLAAKGGGSECEHQPNTPGLYTFFAHGDLDSNNIYSTFELATGSDGANLLYHALAVHSELDVE